MGKTLSYIMAAFAEKHIFEVREIAPAKRGCGGGGNWATGWR
ncbi:uncharacterized protein METZ01_LOCUS406669 [marine metagenome]|uniref:Uncharacterized protein n=1 Tax=marine metagenome TaxID=408172 RepID=A0A382W639_9ZZZZ